MEASIIKIGNSKGLRLSKTILEKYKIKEMRMNNDDNLLMKDVFEEENFEEWS